MNHERLGSPILAVPRIFSILKLRMLNWFSTLAYKTSTASFGSNSYVMHGANLREPSRVHIGNSCQIWSNVYVFSELPNGTLFIGDGVQINHAAILDNSATMKIGEKTLISDNAKLYTHDHGFDPRSKPIAYEKTIGSNVWIGMSATIMPKCKHIGNNAIVGAGAIVTKDVPAGAIVAGNPAKIVAWVNGFSDIHLQNSKPTKFNKET